MNATFPTLEYRPDLAMNPTPVNITLDRIARTLRSGMPVAVELEPGDATRYDLLLVPMISAKVGNYHPDDIQNGLYVMRFVGGDARSCGVILLNRVFHEDLHVLAHNNEWSFELLGW